MSNPFYNRLPIKDPQEFFGRKDELETIFDLIDRKQPQSISIVGDRRVGKTSLLYQLYSRHKDRLRKPEEYLFCFLDLQEKQRYPSCESFYEEVLKSANLNYPSPIDYHKFEEGLRKIRFENNKKLVLLLNEFDTLIKEPRFDSAFLEGLRAIAPKYDISYITDTQRPLKDICHQEAKGSPFFNIFHPLALGVFKRDEAREMLTTLFARGGRQFSEEIIRAILTYVGYHPFYIQLLAYYVFDELARGGSFELVRERFIPEAKAKDHLDYAWKHLTEREKDVIKDLNMSIHRFKDKEYLKVNKEEIDRLKSAGWLIKEDEEYRLTPAFIESLMDEINTPVGESEDSWVTILFADTISSTPIADILPQDEYECFVRQFDELVVNVAKEMNVVYYETHGDGLMFQFFSDETYQQVMSALKSATLIKEGFSRISLNQQRKAAGRGEIGMRFGIHTGKAKVGIYPGGAKRQAKGPTLNVAKRIEEEVARDAKNTKICLSEQSYELVKDKIEALYWGKFSLKGIFSEVGVYEFIDFKS